MGTVSLVDDRLDSAMVARHIPKHIVANICDHVSNMCEEIIINCH